MNAHEKNLHDTATELGLAMRQAGDPSEWEWNALAEDADELCEFMGAWRMWAESVGIEPEPV